MAGVGGLSQRFPNKTSVQSLPSVYSWGLSWVRGTLCRKQKLPGPGVQLPPNNDLIIHQPPFSAFRRAPGRICLE